MILANDLSFYFQDTHSLASRKLEGRKQSKHRVTVALCCNGDGSDKLPPLVIGHFKSPRCFKGVNMKTLGCTYRHNTKAWMTTQHFVEWLRSFELRMERLRKEKVILLLDNFAGHKASKNIDLPELRRTKLVYLPANTTSKLQPLDAGIINNFKLFYRKEFNRCVLRRMEGMDTVRVRSAMDRALGINRATSLDEDPKKAVSIHVREAIDLLVCAWNEVRADTIHNCYRHCRIKTSLDNQEDLSEDYLDPVALADIERTHALLQAQRPGYFHGPMDIQAILNYEDDDIEPGADPNMSHEDLLFADAEDELPASEDDTEEEPAIARKVAEECLVTVKKFIQQQEEVDLVPELASLNRLLSYMESKRVLTLEQTSIHKYFGLN